MIPANKLATVATSATAWKVLVRRKSGKEIPRLSGCLSAVKLEPSVNVFDID